MVRLSLNVVARPGEVKGLAAALSLVMAQARGQRGCVACQLSIDLMNPDTLCYAEEWFTEADLRAQILSERFRLLIGVMELSAECPRFEVLLAADVRGLAYIEAVFGGL